jgi:pyruvate/2-oxoglutarate dehydrogenase complex dihydrolipoamide dehydrogenase (E3) component
MPESLTPDLCVIGAGSSGLSAAAAAATLGVSVVLIERGRMGGDSLNTGSVPAQALIAAARRAHEARTAGGLGVKVQRVNVEFHEVNDHVQGVIAALAPNRSKERYAGLGVRVIEGEARFIDPDTVVVGEGIQIKARRFVVATGTSPSVPPIPGLDETPYLTSETLFEARVRPKHLIVAGGGGRALELAQAFRRLGSEVTVLEKAQPLAGEDPECARIVLGSLGTEGVTIRSGIEIERVRRVRAKVEVVLTHAGESETIEGSDLLIASGRAPNVAGLGLEAARIKYGPAGITVDKYLRTTNKKVYAVGAVAAVRGSAEAGSHHAGLVVRHALFRHPVTLDLDAIPRVTFTDPELAHVGMTEGQARERHRIIRVLRWPYLENDRAQAEGETMGHIKVITTKSGRILGSTLVGAAAGELIAAWTLAVAQGLSIRAFAQIVMPYPTLAEIGGNAALTASSESLTSPWTQRMFGWLRRFG